MKKLSVALAAIFLSSVSNGAEPAKAPPSSGRFQLIELTQYRREYLLDTQTGRIWRNLCQVDAAEGAPCAYHAWTQEDVEGISATRAQIKADTTKVQPD